MLERQENGLREWAVALRGARDRRRTLVRRGLLVAAACGSSGGEASSSSGGSCVLPSTVKVAVVKDQTGVNAAVGVDSWKGVQVGVDQIEKDGTLGSTKLDLEVKDTANSAQLAASDVTQAAADQKVPDQKVPRLFMIQYQNATTRPQMPHAKARRRISWIIV